MSYRQELGQIIRKHRKGKQLSQEKLAEKCNLSLHQISYISLKREGAHKLVDLFNTHSMSAEYLQDIVQDFLSV